jgi:hypothetical protein
MWGQTAFQLIPHSQQILLHHLSYSIRHNFKLPVLFALGSGPELEIRKRIHKPNSRSNPDIVKGVSLDC